MLQWPVTFYVFMCHICHILRKNNVLKYRRDVTIKANKKALPCNKPHGSYSRTPANLSKVISYSNYRLCYAFTQFRNFRTLPVSLRVYHFHHSLILFPRRQGLER